MYSSRPYTMYTLNEICVQLERFSQTIRKEKSYLHSENSCIDIYPTYIQTHKPLNACLCIHVHISLDMYSRFYVFPFSTPTRYTQVQLRQACINGYHERYIILFDAILIISSWCVAESAESIDRWSVCPPRIIS
jgi:hypothetical protein